MRAAIYSRVSTRKLRPGDPADPSAVRDFKQNPQLQIDACRLFAANHGWEIIAEYSDRMTGTKQTRPELEQLKLAAHQRKFDVLVVWKLDRFARRAGQALLAIEDLNAKGVAFVSVTEPQLDTTTPMGRAILGMVAIFAELERDTIAERVKAGMASAKARGKQLGQPKKALPLIEAQELIDQGTSIAGAARRLGISRATLQRRLKALEEAGKQT